MKATISIRHQVNASVCNSPHSNLFPQRKACQRRKSFSVCCYCCCCCCSCRWMLNVIVAQCVAVNVCFMNSKKIVPSRKSRGASWVCENWLCENLSAQNLIIIEVAENAHLPPSTHKLRVCWCIVSKKFGGKLVHSCLNVDCVCVCESLSADGMWKIHVERAWKVESGKLCQSGLGLESGPWLLLLAFSSRFLAHWKEWMQELSEIVWIFTRFSCQGKHTRKKKQQQQKK